MEGADARMVMIDEGQIIHMLQDHMAGIVEDVGARMIGNSSQEPLEGHAVMQILARMQLEAKIDSGLVESVQDRFPALAQFGEALLDQTGRTLRPGIEGLPQQRAG